MKNKLRKIFASIKKILFLITLIVGCAFIRTSLFAGDTDHHSYLSVSKVPYFNNICNYVYDTDCKWLEHDRLITSHLFTAHHHTWYTLLDWHHRYSNTYTGSSPVNLSYPSLNNFFIYNLNDGVTTKYTAALENVVYSGGDAHGDDDDRVVLRRLTRLELGISNKVLSYESPFKSIWRVSTASSVPFNFQVYLKKSEGGIKMEWSPYCDTPTTRDEVLDSAAISFQANNVSVGGSPYQATNSVSIRDVNYSFPEGRHDWLIQMVAAGKLKCKVYNNYTPNPKSLNIAVDIATGTLYVDNKPPTLKPNKIILSNIFSTSTVIDSGVWYDPEYYIFSKTARILAVLRKLKDENPNYTQLESGRAELLMLGDEVGSLMGPAVGDHGLLFGLYWDDFVEKLHKGPSVLNPIISQMIFSVIGVFNCTTGREEDTNVASWLVRAIEGLPGDAAARTLEYYTVFSNSLVNFMVNEHGYSVLNTSHTLNGIGDGIDDERYDVALSSLDADISIIISSQEANILPSASISASAAAKVIHIAASFMRSYFNFGHPVSWPWGIEQQIITGGPGPYEINISTNRIDAGYYLSDGNLTVSFNTSDNMQNIWGLPRWILGDFYKQTATVNTVVALYDISDGLWGPYSLSCVYGGWNGPGSVGLQVEDGNFNTEIAGGNLRSIPININYRIDHKFPFITISSIYQTQKNNFILSFKVNNCDFDSGNSGHFSIWVATRSHKTGSLCSGVRVYPYGTADPTNDMRYNCLLTPSQWDSKTYGSYGKCIIYSDEQHEYPNSLVVPLDIIRQATGIYSLSDLSDKIAGFYIKFRDKADRLSQKYYPIEIDIEEPELKITSFPYGFLNTKNIVFKGVCKDDVGIRNLTYAVEYKPFSNIQFNPRDTVTVFSNLGGKTTCYQFITTHTASGKYGESDAYEYGEGEYWFTFNSPYGLTDWTGKNNPPIVPSSFSVTVDITTPTLTAVSITQTYNWNFVHLAGKGERGANISVFVSTTLSGEFKKIVDSWRYYEDTLSPYTNEQNVTFSTITITLADIQTVIGQQTWPTTLYFKLVSEDKATNKYETTIPFYFGIDNSVPKITFTSFPTGYRNATNNNNIIFTGYCNDSNSLSTFTYSGGYTAFNGNYVSIGATIFDNLPAGTTYQIFNYKFNTAVYGEGVYQFSPFTLFDTAGNYVYYPSTAAVIIATKTLTVDITTPTLTGLTVTQENGNRGYLHFSGKGEYGANISVFVKNQNNEFKAIVSSWVYYEESGSRFLNDQNVTFSTITVLLENIYKNFETQQNALTFKIISKDRAGNIDIKEIYSTIFSTPEITITRNPIGIQNKKTILFEGYCQSTNPISTFTYTVTYSPFTGGTFNAGTFAGFNNLPPGSLFQTFASTYMANNDGVYDFRFYLIDSAGESITYPPPYVLSSSITVTVDVTTPTLTLNSVKQEGGALGYLHFSGKSEYGAYTSISVKNESNIFVNVAGPVGNYGDGSPGSHYRNEQGVAFSTITVLVTNILKNFTVQPTSLIFRISSRDDAGNTDEKETSIYVDVISPTVQLDFIPLWISTFTISITGFASDSSGGSGMKDLTYQHWYSPLHAAESPVILGSDNLTPWPGTPKSIPYNPINFILTGTNTVREGIHQIALSASDNIDNTKDITVKVYVDTCSPTAPDISNNPPYQSQKDKTYVYGYSLDNSGREMVSEIYNSNNVFIASSTFYNNFGIEITSTTFDATQEAISYTFKVRCKDLAGNISGTTSYVFVKDYTYPKIVFDDLKLENQSSIAIASTTTFKNVSGKIIETNLTEAEYTILFGTSAPRYGGQYEIFRSTEYSFVFIDTNTKTFNIALLEQKEGYHSIMIEAKDIAGNTAYKDAVIYLDITPPLMGYLSGTPIINGNEITVIIGGERFTVFQLYTDANFTNLISSGTIDSNGLGQTTFLTVLGQHQYYILTIDDARNTTRNNTPFNITVTSLKPSTPVITKPKKDVIVGNLKPEMQGTATPGSTIVIYIDGQQHGIAQTNPAGHWEYVIKTALSEGYHYVKVKAYMETAVSDDSATVMFLIKLPPGQSAIEETLTIIGPEKVREGSSVVFKIVDKDTKLPVSGVNANFFGEKYVTDTKGIVGRYTSPFIPGIIIKIPKEQRAPLFGSPARTPAKVIISAKISTFKTTRIGSYEFVVLPQDPTKILLSPNNDGINDIIVFSGVELPIKIFDIHGRKVVEISTDDTWYGRDDADQKVPCGIYLWESKDNIRGRIFLRR